MNHRTRDRRKDRIDLNLRNVQRDYQGKKSLTNDEDIQGKENIFNRKKRSISSLKRLMNAVEWEVLTLIRTSLLKLLNDKATNVAYERQKREERERETMVQ